MPKQRHLATYKYNHR